ncbi:hypothetical protein ENUP19_0202G0021 [Entamoeba nuttalli]
MILLIIISVVLGIDTSSMRKLCQRKQYVSAFRLFKESFSKRYLSQSEEIRRMAIFSQRVQMIEKFNAKRKTESDVKLDINNFTDLTNEEFVQMYIGGKKWNENVKNQNIVNNNYIPKKNNYPTMYSLCGKNINYNSEADGKIDHCSLGVDQKLCRCCYAASIANFLQIKHHIANGENVQYSIQQIVDCTGGKTTGCCSGMSYDALNYNRVFATSDVYPFRDAETSPDCQSYTRPSCYTVKEFAQTLTSYKEWYAPTYSEIKQIIYDNKGAISGIYVPLSGVASEVWQSYSSGIINVSSYCSSNNGNIFTNHMVVLVGFGFEAQGEGVNGNFVIIRNSWGTEWGDKGTAKLSADSLCGIGNCDGENVPCSHPTLITLETEVGPSTKQDYGCLQNKCSPTNDCDGVNCLTKSLDPPPNHSVGIVIIMLVTCLMMLF